MHRARCSIFSIKARFSGCSNHSQLPVSGLLVSLDLGSVVVSKTLGKMAGLETVQQVVQFLVLMQGLYGGFRERYGAIEKLLRSEGLGFVLVASAQSEQLQAARDFRAQLEGERYEIEGMILNRVRASLVDAEMLEVMEPTTDEGRALLETLRDEARGDAHSRALRMSSLRSPAASKVRFYMSFPVI